MTNYTVTDQTGRSYYVTKKAGSAEMANAHPNLKMLRILKIYIRPMKRFALLLKVQSGKVLLSINILGN